jgi:hypothetical protein
MRLNKDFISNTPKQMTMSFGEPVEQIYYDSLPIQPFCSESKDGGYFRTRRDKAILYPIIQHNPDYLVRILMFDIDKPKNATKYWTVEQHIEDSGAPEPNCLMKNPENGHGHVGYLLTTPVPITDNSSMAAIRYAVAIERRLALKLNADIGYTGFVSKNLLHDKWLTTLLHRDSYDLQELEVWLTPEQQALTRPNSKKEIDGLGRRMRIFTDLRYWSYRHVINARKTMTHEQWFNRILQQCEIFNTFNNPLAYTHIKSTAKSVAKWTWNKYTGKGTAKNYGRDTAKNHQLELNDKQTYAAIKTNEQRKQTSERKIEAAIRLLKKENKRVSVRSVAEKARLSKTTIQAHKNLLKSVPVRCTSDNPALKSRVR